MRTRLSRRDVLTIVTAGTAVHAIRGAAPARAAEANLSFLRATSPVPAFDAYFTTILAPSYEKHTGIKITGELLGPDKLRQRVALAATSGIGPDIALSLSDCSFRHPDAFADLTEIAGQIGGESGGWHDAAKEVAVIDGKWKSIPFGNVGQLMNWRMDWFHQAGFEKFPESWDELLHVGTTLKQAGHPFGFVLSGSSADSQGWLYPLLWSFGGREVAPDGRTIALDSDETARAVDFCRTFVRQTMPDDVLNWTDASNQVALFSERISCTSTSETSFYPATKDSLRIAATTGRALNPVGPGGRFHVLAPCSDAVFTHSEALQAGTNFLRWLMQPDQAGPWYASAGGYYAPFLKKYDDAPLWHVEPRNLPYRNSLATAHLPGWPAPIGRPQSESVARHVIVDMFAAACTGGSTKSVITAAVAQLRQIYRSAS
jgi:multiple sugar transport system substrate-binding protein